MSVRASWSAEATLTQLRSQSLTCPSHRCTAACMQRAHSIAQQERLGRPHPMSIPGCTQEPPGLPQLVIRGQRSLPAHSCGSSSKPIQQGMCTAEHLARLCTDLAARTSHCQPACRCFHCLPSWEKRRPPAHTALSSLIPELAQHYLARGLSEGSIHAAPSLEAGAPRKTGRFSPTGP